MIIPEKIILLTGNLVEDARAKALEEHINGKIFGYHVITIKEEQITNKFSSKWQNSTLIYGIRHGINFLDDVENLRKVKVKRLNKSKPKTNVKYKKKSQGKFKRINNVARRFDAKAILCMNTNTLYQTIKAKEKFGFKAMVIGCLDSFTFDKHTTPLGADKYIVENNEFKDELIKRGVNKENVIIKRFPIEKDVFIDETESELRSLFDIDEKPTVLLNGGSVGDYEIVEIFKLLLEVEDRFNIIVYCGENETLYQRFARAKESGNLNNVKLFTTVNNIEKLYKAVDCIVSVYDVSAIYKAKVLNKPIILFAPKRDVEEQDFKYLNKVGDAIYAKDSSDVVSRIFDVTNHTIVKPDKNVDEIRSSTIVASNFLMDLLSDKK